MRRDGRHGKRKKNPFHELSWKQFHSLDVIFYGGKKIQLKLTQGDFLKRSKQKQKKENRWRASVLKSPSVSFCLLTINGRQWWLLNSSYSLHPRSFGSVFYFWAVAMTIVSEWSTSPKSLGCAYIFSEGRTRRQLTTVFMWMFFWWWWRRLRKWLINRQEFLNVRFAFFFLPFTAITILSTHPCCCCCVAHCSFILRLFFCLTCTCLSPSSLYPTR